MKRAIGNPFPPKHAKHKGFLQSVNKVSPAVAEAMASFAWERELLPRRPPGDTGVGSTSELGFVFKTSVETAVLDDGPPADRF